MPGPAVAAQPTARAREMAGVVAEAERSGLSLREFARQRGIEPGMLSGPGRLGFSATGGGTFRPTRTRGTTRSSRRGR